VFCLNHEPPGECCSTYYDEAEELEWTGTGVEMICSNSSSLGKAEELQYIIKCIQQWDPHQCNCKPLGLSIEDLRVHTRLRQAFVSSLDKIEGLLSEVKIPIFTNLKVKARYSAVDDK
jgi:hypothetical protein